MALRESMQAMPGTGSIAGSRSTSALRRVPGLAHRINLRANVTINPNATPQLHGGLALVTPILRPLALLGLAHEGALGASVQAQRTSPSCLVLQVGEEAVPSELSIRARLTVCAALQPALFDLIAELRPSQAISTLVALAQVAARMREGLGAVHKSTSPIFVQSHLPTSLTKPLGVPDQATTARLDGGLDLGALLAFGTMPS